PRALVVCGLRWRPPRRAVVADGGGVLRPGHHQARSLHWIGLVQHRLREDHVVEQRRAPGDDFLPGPALRAGEHLDPAVVLRAPLPGVVGRLLVLADSLGSRLQLTRVPLVDAAPGYAEPRPILQTDG